MFKNLTVGKKLVFGFSLVLILLIVVGVISIYGANNMKDTSADTVHKNHIIETLTHREIDHLNWANKVAELLTNEKVTELSVQTDDHKCAFGQWLYGDERKKAEHAIPELVPILKEIEGCHADLHSSAIDIGEHFRQADAKIPGLIAARQIDHLKWADTIRDAFLENADTIDVQTDSHKCALGKWLVTPEAKKAYENGSDSFRKYWDQMVVAHDELHKSAIDICEHIGQGEEGKAHSHKLFEEKTLPILHDVMSQMDSMKVAAETDLDGMKKANEVYNDVTKPSLAEVQKLLTEAGKHVSEVVEEANSHMVSSAQITTTVVSILTIAAVVMGVIAAFMIGRSLISALKGIISDLNAGSEQVSAASTQISSASQSLAQGSTEQAASLEETSSSLEEMSSMTKQNADNAQQANTLAAEAKKVAENGAEAVHSMTGAINDIQKSSDETAKIIKVIDEIAFQTNLLALNAAVEAARAGEAGKGFAVVAEEVRNLAMRSAEAAKNTAALIEESVKNSNSGVEITKQVNEALTEIVQSVAKTSDLVSEITAASQEQAQGIDQINTAVTQMDKVTQQNAANAEQSASASEELNAQAKAMNEVVGQLVALVGGSGIKRSKVVQPQNNRNTQLSQQDRMFHEIADDGPNRKESVKEYKGTVKKRKESAAVIPFDEDSQDGFEQFNN